MNRAFRYAFDEAMASLWRGRGASVLSTITIAIALLVLGGFLLVTANLERLAEAWAGTAALSVYMEDDVSAEELAKIEQVIAPGTVVASRSFVSKDAAAARFRETFTDLAGTLDGLGGNPLPASYEVELQPSGAAAGVETLAATLRETPGVSDVRYDRQWLARLGRIVAIVRGAGLLLGVILTTAAALTVANVVRLALYARRDELAIMRLVGAPQVYIRGPFVMEGMLQGGLGAAVALAILAAAFLSTRSAYLQPLAEAVGMTNVAFLPAGVCVLLLLGGMAVGSLGGFVAARTADVTES